IITLVLMPVLLYPLLYIAFQQFILASHQPSGKVSYGLGFRSGAEFLRVVHHLGWKIKEIDHQKMLHPLVPQPPPRDAPPAPALRVRFPVNPTEKKDPKYLDKLIRDGAVDVGIRVRQSPTGAAGIDLEVVYLEDSVRGREVAAWMDRQAA